MIGCWIAEHVPHSGPCDGRLVRGHLIPKQLLKREGLGDLVWDERVWVPVCGGVTGCGGHHGALDYSRTVRIPRSLMPAGVEEFAAEHGLGWWLAREYGEAA